MKIFPHFQIIYNTPTEEMKVDVVLKDEIIWA